MNTNEHAYETLLGGEVVAAGTMLKRMALQ
jgi:hypothetical protein